MAEKDDRIICRYCGSNNFKGAVTCWQCNRPVHPEVSPLDAPSATPSFQPLSGRPAPSSYVSPLDTAAGDKAAIALGLLFPLFGYPIGLAFIMLDTPRKVQLGKLAILWSTIGLVLSTVLSIMLIAPLAAGVKQLIPSGNPLTHMSLPNGDEDTQ